MGPEWTGLGEWYVSGRKLEHNTAVNQGHMQVEVLSGKRLGEFIHKNICGPLSLQSTTFHPGDTTRF